MLSLLRIDEAAAATPPEPQNFIGRVLMQNLARQAGAAEFEIFAGFCDAGSRTRPHTHPGEQILHFVRGSGFVAFPGEPEQSVAEGSIVVVPAGVVHMHGATAGAPICHVAIRAASGPTDWHPEVP